ncbi:PREDICTED: uncharacterized protein LOC104567750 [Tinamus guttatus]|uniref:uncharacterized protein LOC104567750 n=1 Tax=Tinamus guttatus TaxID=94827 RepID=UPI00052E8C9F|nr:PREDICTED: uncharacterized protein LOC104567750 [Tinamus guttatus]
MNFRLRALYVARKRDGAKLCGMELSWAWGRQGRRVSAGQARRAEARELQGGCALGLLGEQRGEGCSLHPPTAWLPSSQSPTGSTSPTSSYLLGLKWMRLCVVGKVHVAGVGTTCNLAKKVLALAEHGVHCTHAALLQQACRKTSYLIGKLIRGCPGNRPGPREPEQRRMPRASARGGFSFIKPASPFTLTGCGNWLRVQRARGALGQRVESVSVTLDVCVTLASDGRGLALLWNMVPNLRVPVFTVPAVILCCLALPSAGADSKPTFMKAPEDQIGISGGVASFVCQATGEPKPRITWMKKGKKVSSQRFEVIEFDDGSGSVLRIQPLRVHRDEAIYECTATNSVGEINTSAKLTVLEGFMFCGKTVY